MWWKSRPFIVGALPFLLACLAALPAAAQTIDKPAATVKLNKLEVITVKQFKQQVQDLEERTRTPLSTDDRSKLLDLLISEILVNQAAARDGVVVSDAEVASRIDLARKNGGVTLNLNRELTDDELNTVLQRSGLTLASYKDQMKKAILQQKYVMKKKQALIANIAPPAEAEIVDFYESNKAVFVSPDMVRFKHIFIDTRSLNSQADRDKAKDRADRIYRELQGGAAFEDLVAKYSEDKVSRYTGGDFGYIRRDDAARRQLLGKDFFDAPFRMKAGEVSQVLRSNIGFHIIKIVEVLPFKLLGLDDKIPPQNTATVRDEVRAQLLQRKQAELYQKALLEIVDELKKKAEIKIFEQNLTW